ncbi:MAG: T9SS type A sorting domain-containing protein [Polaribacter sp.]|nr:T9SS type A sorting domain-containing protein [Polaribacter sp.]
MIKKITLLLFFVSFIAQSQIQIDAPWSQELQKKGGKTSELTLKEISKSAEAYFATIDRNKKGSGLKPFERWKYHWGFYTDASGKIKPSSDLWDAWEVKQARKANSKNENTGNWTPVGPFQSSNTYSSPSLKSSGQGRINVVAVDPSNPNTYYVGAPAGGIWKSTDAGINWAPLTDYLPQIGVSGIAIHPTNSNIIYIATGDDDAGDSYAVGVWKSLDGGATWNATGTITGSPLLMNDIYIHPNNPETIVVATSTGIQKSINGGASWKTTLALNVTSKQTNLDLKMKPGDPETYYVAARNRFWRSINGASTFKEITITGISDSYRLAMDVTKANSNYIYIVSYIPNTGPGNNGFNGIFKSTDSGETFTKTTETKDIFGGSQAWYDLAITASDVNPEIVYVGVLDIFKSTDGGNNFSKITYWTLPDSESYVHADIHFLRFIDGKFFAGTDGGVYVSTNEGAKFTDLTENLSISQFYKISVATQDSSILAGGLQDNGGFAFNNNKWINYHGGDGMEGNVDPTNKKVHYGFIQYGGNLYKSDDNGESLSLRLGAPDEETGTNDSGGEWVTPMAINSDGEVYAGYNKVYKIVNNEWQLTSNFDFEVGEDLDQLEISPLDKNIIFAAEGASLYRSLDAGVNFTQIAFTGGTINGIEPSPLDPNTVFVVSNSGVHKSVNINSVSPTFVTIGTNTPQESKLVVKFHKRSGNNTIYLGTSLGVYYLNDDNTDWQVFDTNLPNVAVKDLDINERDSKLIAATYGRGVFVTDIPRILPKKDLSITSIANLNNTIVCNSATSPILSIKNEGTDVINEVVIEYIYNDDSTKESYTWTGTINSLETKEISLPQKTFEVKTHKLDINIILASDDFVDNNSYTSYFKVNNSISDPFFINQFETDNVQDILLTESTRSTGWQKGIPKGVLLKTASSGTSVYGTNLAGEYPTNTTNYLYSNCYDLSVIVAPKVKFQMAFDIEKDWDYLVFEYSKDAGKTWNILGNADSPNWYTSAVTTDDSNSSTLPGRQWTGEGENAHPLGGTNATLREYSHDLSSIGTETNVIFRFKFYSDEAATEEGVIIDDFGITGASLSTNDIVVQNELLVYPNPSKDTFNLSWNFVGNADISVYNYLGKTILSKNNIKENKYQIDLSNQSKGLYFIKINVDGKQAVKKVILE